MNLDFVEVLQEKDINVEKLKKEVNSISKYKDLLPWNIGYMIINLDIYRIESGKKKKKEIKEETFDYFKKLKHAYEKINLDGLKNDEIKEGLSNIDLLIPQLEIETVEAFKDEKYNDEKLVEIIYDIDNFCESYRDLLYSYIKKIRSVNGNKDYGLNLINKNGEVINPIL